MQQIHKDTVTTLQEVIFCSLSYLKLEPKISTSKFIFIFNLFDLQTCNIKKLYVRFGLKRKIIYLTDYELILKQASFDRVRVIRTYLRQEGSESVWKDSGAFSSVMSRNSRD